MNEPTEREIEIVTGLMNVVAMADVESPAVTLRFDDEEGAEHAVYFPITTMRVLIAAMARAVEDAVGDASETSETPEGDGLVSVEDRLPDHEARMKRRLRSVAESNTIFHEPPK